MDSAQLLTGSYSYGLVAASVLNALLAAYTALDLAGRVTAIHGFARLGRLSGGTLAPH
jgi:NO-binding membrane sensor protein with MHYT domain